MKIAVVGAGAIGGYVGGWLAAGGEDVTFIARGANLHAIRRKGMRVIGEDGTEVIARASADDKTSDAGPQDVVVLAVKAHQVGAIAADLAALCHAETAIVTMQNGIPWWYFHKHGGDLEGLRLEKIDPGGIISSVIEPDRVIGSIVYFAAEIAEPGVIRHIDGNRISLGEPDGSRSDRIRKLAEILIRAGLRAPITTRIRQEIWVKLLGNLSFNPISAVTGATLVEIARDPDISALVRHIMEEAQTVATRIGIELPISIEQRIAGAEKVGEHKTSMLQDLESGRPLEIEALVGAVLELGERLDVAMPYTSAVYACTKLLAKMRSQR